MARERRPGIPRSVIFDARIHTVESEIPPLDEVLDGLATDYAEAITRAVEDAVPQGAVPRPFLLLVSASVFPRVELVDDLARMRRRELAFEVSEFPFYEAVELPLLDYLADATLRRCRQAAQAGSRRDLRRHRRGPIDRAELERRRRCSGAWMSSGGRCRQISTSGGSRGQPQISWRPSARPPDRGSLRRRRSGPSAWRRSGPRCGRGQPNFRVALPPSPIATTSSAFSWSRGVGQQLVERLPDLAEWGFRLAPAAGASRMGGLPDLPVGTAWPVFDGRPLNFIAQVDLGELPAVPGHEVMPGAGRLLFFFAVDDALFEPAGAGPDDRARVVYVPPGVEAQEASPPPTVVPYMARTVVAVSRLTLPSPSPSITALGLDHYEMQAYTAAWERSLEMKGTPPTHRYHDQLLGHARPIQEDPRMTPDDQSKDWTLLLAVHDDASICLDLADAGALYFMIPRDALAGGEWDACFVDAQSG